MAEGYRSILDSGFSAAEGSFLLRLRCELVWDRGAFARLTAAMRACCEDMQGRETLERCQTEGFCYVSWFVRSWGSPIPPSRGRKRATTTSRGASYWRIWPSGTSPARARISKSPGGTQLEPGPA